MFCLSVWRSNHHNDDDNSNNDDNDNNNDNNNNETNDNNKDNSKKTPGRIFIKHSSSSKSVRIAWERSQK